METKVLTQEEVTNLKSVRDKRLQLTESFGILELKLQEISLQKEYLKEELQKLRQEETTLGKILQDKYGDGSIDLEKGEFISS
mgnify:CR=1 FL=1